MMVLIKGTHYTSLYGMSVHYSNDLVEEGRTFQGDVLIEASALNEVQ